MRKKLELLTACLLLAGATMFYSCQSMPPVLPESSEQPPKPIPTGFVYIESNGQVLEIPRAVWEFNPSAYPPPMDPQPTGR